MDEITKVIVIPVEEVFEGVNISINHLPDNEKFFVCYFFGQNEFNLELKLQIFHVKKQRTPASIVKTPLLLLAKG